ncbi:hypothetical protein MRB53_024311 [Persea americana]|uniref:Uncharacterized protein n=1 Tax=Persea americana TaxID=3435 RepID=A0ACC2LD18_PERAE|nr:hypothetical protein MRB53_024311 [Persea americana]
MGKRLLNRWLKQPLLDVDEINCRLDLVQAFVGDTALHHDLRQHLKRISDIERLMHNLQKRRASLQHIVKLYQSSIRLPYIKSSLGRYAGQFLSLIKGRYLDPLENWTDDDHLNMFIALVEASVDLEKLENGEYMIASGYDPNLSALKNDRDAVEQQIHNLHKQTANDLDLPFDKALKLDKSTQFGHDGVKFTNTKLKKLSDQYLKLLEEYTNCQKELVAQVVQTAATFSEVFESLAGILSEMDVLLSFADLSTSCPTPYIRPDITHSDKGDIILEGSRHPCVEAQDGVNFIPNDCSLVRGKSLFQIITGPNMGGKSTFIRQVGVNVLMAQVGCWRLSGLAWAICEHLVQVTRAPNLFATHFHELTALANEDGGHESHRAPISGVANYHVGAHIDSSSHKLTMLYKVEPGACDQSFGIHLAEFANFPQSVVNLAREKAAELEDFSSTPVISNNAKEEVGSKRKRLDNPDDMGRGAAWAHQFLHEFAALPLDQLDLKHALQQISKMRCDLERDAAEHPWLQQFF